MKCKYINSKSLQVEGLNDRMVDVDSNLNYMLGQLSLVVQEFNQVNPYQWCNGASEFWV